MGPSTGNDRPPQDDLILPAQLTLTGRASEEASAPVSAAPMKPFWLGALLGGLVVVALVVILLLPGFVRETAPPADVPAAPAPTPNATQTGPAPWEAAQQARSRKAAQDVLEQLLDRQFQLEELSVARWAGEPFAAARQQATDGDERYRTQQFEAATAAYTAALAAMEQLLAGVDGVVAQQLAAGQAALAAGNASAAQAAFDLVLAIRPDHAEAAAGLKRAGALDEVLSLVAEADRQAQAGQLDTALATLQQAARLDPAAESVKSRLATLRGQAGKRDFRQRMSAGYAALQRNDHAAAQREFQAALKREPGAAEAQEALRQAREAASLAAIETHLAAATSLAGQEQWAQAVAEYDRALAIDNALADAVERRRTAEERAKLDAALADAIARPERLATDAVRRAAQVLHDKAAAIAMPGPRLAGQVAELKKQLELAVIPIPVVFQSDNLSKVVLFKVGELGSFQSRQLELKPGDYVVVARREGYRDARKEFQVRPDMAIVRVSIQCNQPI